jgi:hypothetical protein
MGWERRAQCRDSYYYVARKVGGRVVKTYIGRGPLAEVAAAQDAAVKAERRASIAAVRNMATLMAPADSALRALAHICELLAAANLAAAGYRRVHYEWRRPRGQA